VTLRPATAADAARLTEIHLTSRAAAMPWLATPHDAQETAAWMAGVVLVEDTVLVDEEGGEVRGFAALHDDRLEQLYVDPARQGRGVGSRLLAAAQALRPGGLELFVFTRNAGARRFYERAGFVLVEQGDGSGNEEREPDCLYRWR